MIRLALPFLPPSSNHAYVNVHGKRILSREGRAFKIQTTIHLVQMYRQELIFFKPNIPYFLFFRFHFKSIENKGWTTGKVDSRYKKFDGGNRMKLLEDCLKDAGGIDDSQTMTTIWQKKQGLPERTEIWAWNMESESDPFDIDFILEHL